MPLDPALADLLDKMTASASYVRPASTDLAGARQAHEADASRFTPPGQRATVADVLDTHIATPVLDLDLDRGDRYPSLRDNADGYYVTRDELRWCVRNYLPAGTDPADPRISPARQTDLAGLPATVLAVAQYDPLRDQGTAYARALRATSVPVAVHQGLGLIHGCFDMLGVTAAARDEIDRVLCSIPDALAVTPSTSPAARLDP